MNAPQKRGAAVTMLTSRSRPVERAIDSQWAEINRRIQAGRVIPVISNSFYLDAIFSALIEQSASSTADPVAAAPFPIKMMSENLLSQAWAEKIHYPLPDTHDLARVAQFHRARCKDDEEAKVGFLDFLKEALLAYAENLGIAANILDELYARTRESTFADLVQELGFPRYENNQIDPLRILARLPLPIYVTTSCHDFLERALLLENKRPFSRTYYQKGEEKETPPEEQEPKPTIECPLVFHLYGIETLPKTLVLSEEDYLNFLVKVTQKVTQTIETDQVEDQERPTIPVKLRSVLAVSSLILLGYRLQDWDFRVLFRGIVNPDHAPSRGFSLILQLTPDLQFNIENVQEARKYLETYFQPRQFEVTWGRPESFLNELWDEWNKWRLGE